MATKAKKVTKKATPKLATITQLVAMAALLGYDKAIANGSPRWQLYSLTAAHGQPSTHVQARTQGDALARKLTGNANIAISNTPKLHYAKATGGVASPFATSYHPRRFAERTKLAGFDLVCVEHATRYDKCSTTCLIVVRKGEKPLVDIVRRTRSKSPTTTTRRRTRRTAQAKPTDTKLAEKVGQANAERIERIAEATEQANEPVIVGN